MMGHLGETVDELEGAEEGAQAAGEDERRRGERGFDGLCLLCIRAGGGRRKNRNGMEHGARERGCKGDFGERKQRPSLPRSASGQNTFVYVIN